MTAIVEDVESLNALLDSDLVCLRKGCDSPASHRYFLHIEMAGVRFPRRSGCQHVVEMCLNHGNDEFLLHLMAMNENGNRQQCRLCAEPFTDVLQICRSMGPI